MTTDEEYLEIMSDGLARELDCQYAIIYDSITRRSTKGEITEEQVTVEMEKLYNSHRFLAGKIAY